jgi:ArsR family transcriptional regulator, arsenate/arsenite/antimonite-responsive transcriptional repressor
MNTETAQMESLFLALGDKTRLRLLNLMSGGEICVCFFTEALQEPQPKISRHLAYLRQARLVETRRDGKWIYYRLAKPSNENAARILRSVQSWLENDEQMKQDRERLVDICCTPDKMMAVTIQRAPKNDIFAKANVMSEKETELADFLL